MEDELLTLANRLGRLLQQRGQLLATAESCTGGWVAKTMTDVAGSSAWFDCGFVTYSNQSKQRLLGVESDFIAAHGAVSEAVVKAMVDGALANSSASLALAVSGVAGPGGGTPEKPVGTVWFAWGSSLGDGRVQRELFGGDREAVRRQAVVTALKGALTFLG